MSRTNTQPVHPLAHLPPSRAAGGPSMGPQFAHHPHPHPAQPGGGAPNYRQPAGHTSPGLVHHPPPDPMEILAQRFSQTMLEILGAHQAHNETRIDRIETNIQRLVSETSDARRETRESTAGYIGQIAEVLKTSHEIQLARLQRLELVLGMGPDMKDEKTLLARFDLLSFAVEELLERLKDPEANLPAPPLHHDMATSPLKGVYADAGVIPRTPSPSPHLSSVAVSPSPPVNETISEDNSLSENNSLSTIVGDESLPNISGKLFSRKDGGQNEVRMDQQADTGDLFAGLVPRAAASPVTRPLVPVDWNDQSPSPRSFAFDPDQSPEGMKQYSALPIPPPPSDGTVASLRHATFGDRVSGPLGISTPYRSTSVHPMSPALSVSPSQSPRQLTSLPTDSYDAALSSPEDDALLAAAHDRTVPSERQTPPTPTRESSVGAHLPRPTNAVPRSAAPSRAATAEPNSSVHPESPSADTIREELSVRNMTPQPEAHSNVLSPAPPLPSTDIEHIVPSSVTPSPMLEAQFPASSPPRLTLEIPDKPPTPFHSIAEDLFDPFMSPLSASTPSEPPSPLPKSEAMERRIPVTSGPPSGRPTVSGLRLRAPDVSVSVSAPPIVTKKRKAKPQAPESASTQEPPLKRARQPSNQAAGRSNVKKEKGKKRKKVNDLVWPEVIPDDAAPNEFIGKFIGCDKCERWFHCTCMAVVKGDSRLEGTFHCPFCVA
ncbi:hypothetical protein C8F04DRAFT_615060 [Mycena alexandri]|uniref:PHD-type domain-containing protein n=1 Tax=Mycena alexandri TaxID=1745969 RepID=A0AAD6X220_9AGAR|nr:hypothetical protein C8F04DRAFT_615060 [Mycena alexandri]